MPAYVGATLARTRKLDAGVKPKKLTLSRKGFDSGSGDCPSPISPDGTMFPLPIPSWDQEAFDDLQHGDIDIDIRSIVAGLTVGTSVAAPQLRPGAHCSSKPDHPLRSPQHPSRLHQILSNTKASFTSDLF